MTLLRIISLPIIAFGVFLFTLHPSVAPYRDSGDLIVASRTIGIAHPPGYPLYIMSGKIATQLIPWGNAGYRMNVLSAIYGAAALLFLALLLLQLFPGSVAPLGALLVLAFSPAYWRLSQVSEMYSFNAFLVALLLFAAAKLYYGYTAERSGNMPLLCGIGFFCGLACGNHQTIVLLFPGLLLLFRGGGYQAKEYLQAALFFLLGLSVYVFLPLRAATHPLSNWGDPENFSRLLRLMTRSDYGGMRLHPEQSKFEWSFMSLLGQAGVYLRSLVQQFGWPAAVAGVLGIAAFRKDKFFAFLIVSLLLSGPFFIILSNLPPQEKTTLPILEPHLILPGIVFSVFIAAGIRLFSRWRMGIAAAVVLVCISFIPSRSQCNYRSHFFAYDYGRNVLATVGKGGIIYDPDDPTAFITSYLQVIHGRRQDVRLAAFFRTQWGYEQLKRRSPDILPERAITSGQELSLAILDYNRARVPVYAELPVKFPQNYRSYPQGLMCRLSAAGEDLSSGSQFAVYAQHGFSAYKANYDFFTNQIISYYAAAHNNLGLAYANRLLFDAAEREYNSALAIQPDLMAAYNNLGTLAFMRGRYADAERFFRTVVNNDANNPSAFYNLGLSLKVQKKFASADEAFRNAWETWRYPDAGNELGLSALNSGDVRMAIGIFNDIIARNAGYLPAYYNLGLAFQKAGDYGQSRRAFEMYLRNITDIREQKEVRAILQRLP